jgi:hypothetical protein
MVHAYQYPCFISSLIVVPLSSFKGGTSIPLNFVGFGPVSSTSASATFDAGSAGMARIGEVSVRSGNSHEMRIVRKCGEEATVLNV